MELVLLAFVVGFAIAVPALGPATALIVRHMMRGRQREGFAFAIGATSAEGLACLAALWGVELAFGAIPGLRNVLEWGGAALVFGIGLYFMVTAGPSLPDPKAIRKTGAATLGGHTLAGFALTAFNPALIATWATIVGIGVSVTDVRLASWQKWAIPPAVTLGELTWFALLSVLTKHYGTRLHERTIGWIIRVIGAVLVVLGAWGLIQKIAGTW